MTPIPLTDRVVLREQPTPQSQSLILRVSDGSHFVYATVEAIGPEVTEVAPGQRVLVNKALCHAVLDYLVAPEPAIVAFV